MKKSKLCKIVSVIIANIATIVAITTAIFILVARNRFIEIYKDCDISFNYLPAITQFSLSLFGRLIFLIFFIGIAIFLILKELRIAKKGITLLINIIALVLIIFTFSLFAFSVIIPIFGPITHIGYE